MFIRFACTDAVAKMAVVWYQSRIQKSVEAEVFRSIYGGFIKLCSGIVGYLHSCLVGARIQDHASWMGQRKAVRDDHLYVTFGP